MPGDADIEWLDLEPLETPSRPDVVRFGGPRRPWGHGGPRRGPGWHWWYALIALALAAAVVVAIRPGHGTSSAGPTPHASPSASSSRASLSPSAPLAGSTPVGTVATTEVGHPLLDVAPDWELFARGSSAVYGLRLAAGQVVSTEIPLMSSSGSASFLEGPGQVILLSLNIPDGYTIPDGKSFQDLSPAFPQVGPAIPGPDPAHLWVPGPNSTMVLVGFDGTPTGVSVKIPSDADPVLSDAAGYMIFTGTGGVYDVRPSGVSRITTGILLAAGPTRWLTDECDDQYHCAPTVIDRATGSRHSINVAPDRFASGGVISPDGTTAALLESDTDDFNQPVTLHLINLATGADRATTMTVDPNQNFQPGLLVWSPDSRWVFATNATGRVYAISAPAGQTTTLDVTLGPVSQLALRTAAG